MNLKNKIPQLLIGAFLVAGGAVFVSKIFSSSSGAMIVDVKVPALSDIAKDGKKSFDENCVACHGANASGSEKGPPLVHKYYNPGHHADQAFYLAAKRGVQMHHWQFGNMPPQPQISEREMAEVIQYVRELQRANGIFYRQHQM